jgi:CCR4-NOT transcription complex subunit 3
VLQALLAACAPRSIPTPADSAWSPVPPRCRSLPRGPPASYPATRPPALDAPALYERLDTEALFFAFYYAPGSHAQHLAARELKRQSWRYHKTHGAWFQRHEEPKEATAEYERGTYVYFDYSVVHDDARAGWCYRLKQDFTFHYDCLDDAAL